MNWLREANDSSNFEKESWCQTRGGVSVARFDPITISHTCYTALRTRATRSNWPKCSHLAPLAWKDTHESNAATYAVSWPSWRAIVCHRDFFLFTGVFYFRLHGIFRSAVTGRPEMSRVAVTRWLFRFIPGDVECERGREREKDTRRDKKRREEGGGSYYLYRSKTEFTSL